MWAITKVLCLGLVLFSLVACGSSSDDDDDADSQTGEWTLSMRYRYYYYPSGDDSEGLRQREEDDNNADGITDEYWVYYYEDDPVNTGERRLYQYFHHIGEYDEGTRDATGYYDYDDDTGELIELEHVPLDGSASERWEYTNENGLRTGYTYYVDNVVSETGTYRYDENDNIIELKTSNGTWYYDLNSNGERISYDYYEDGEMVREGTYVYDEDGNLVRLDSYEPM